MNRRQMIVSLIGGAGLVSVAQADAPPVEWRAWQMWADGSLRVEGTAVGGWQGQWLPTQERGLAPRLMVVQVWAAGPVRLLVVVDRLPPLRVREELSVPCIEIGDSRWFPLSGRATLVVGGEGPWELRVGLAEKESQ